jgi:hypothetical protein
VDAEVKAIQASAKAAGLGPFRTTLTKHYLGIGDAPDGHRADALAICKQLAETFIKHFHDKGFAVKLPDHRLPVVILKDQETYEKFLGEAPGTAVGGHYDPESNHLVIFDFRPGDEQPVANAKRVNLFTLIHEEIHQLCFNTGLVERKGDVPHCISEGLAAYGESWWPRSRVGFGQRNDFRKQVLTSEHDLQSVWIPTEKLVKDDSAFEAEDTTQLAYAQSWLLVHYLMHTSARLRQFRAYLGAIRDRQTPKARLDDATAHFGELGKLDRDLIRYARRVR